MSLKNNGKRRNTKNDENVCLKNHLCSNSNEKCQTPFIVLYECALDHCLICRDIIKGQQLMAYIEFEEKIPCSNLLVLNGLHFQRV